jgi:hypothetical protein
MPLKASKTKCLCTAKFVQTKANVHLICTLQCFYIAFHAFAVSIFEDGVSTAHLSQAE